MKTDFSPLGGCRAQLAPVLAASHSGFTGAGCFPRPARNERGLGEGRLAKTPHTHCVIAKLLRTKQAQYIRRLESPSSPRPSPPLFVEERGTNRRLEIIRARTMSRYASGILTITAVPFQCRSFSIAMRTVLSEYFPGNGVCHLKWENRLTVSVLITPTNRLTFAGAL